RRQGCRGIAACRRHPLLQQRRGRRVCASGCHAHGHAAYGLPRVAAVQGARHPQALASRTRRFVMRVELEKTFPMPGSAEVAWEFLQNIEAVAGCMPGAKITAHLPDGSYKGTVTVRVGPATMAFRGE